MSFIAPKETQKTRIETCYKCPNIGMVPIANIAKCNSCGCPIRTKIVPVNSKCPEGKW
jgi:hypothetical protein